jgi:hypothetical protein
MGIFLALLRPKRRGELRALAALGVSPRRVLVFAMVGMLPVASLLFGATWAAPQKFVIPTPRPLLRAQPGGFAGEGFVFVREPADAIHLVHDTRSEKHQAGAQESATSEPSESTAHLAHRGKVLGASSWLLGLALALALGMAMLAYPRWPGGRIRNTVVLAAAAMLATLLLAQAPSAAAWFPLGPALFLIFLWREQRTRVVTTPSRTP